MKITNPRTIRARHRAKQYRQDYQAVAEFIRKLRHAMNMTQEKFSAYLGVSEITVRRWETGLGHLPDPVSWNALSYANGKSIPRRIRKFVDLQKDRLNRSRPRDASGKFRKK